VRTLIAKVVEAKDEHYYWGYMGFTPDEGDMIIAALRYWASHNDSSGT
jgi:hypothetical protein